MPKSHHSQSITKNAHELFSQSYLSLYQKLVMFTFWKHNAPI